MIDFEIRQIKHAMRESHHFLKKVDKRMGGVVLPHNFVVLGSSVASYITST